MSFRVRSPHKPQFESLQQRGTSTPGRRPTSSVPSSAPTTPYLPPEQYSTAEVLNNLWARQGQPYRKVGEPRPASGAMSKSSPALRGTRAAEGRSSTRRSFDGGLVDVEARQDRVLGTLVSNGDQWGKTQELQGRLASDNRGLQRRSFELRRETHGEISSTRPPPGWVNPARTDREAAWPNPIASRVQSHYETTYRSCYGLKDIHQAPRKPKHVEERTMWSMPPFNDRAEKEDDLTGRYPSFSTNAEFNTPGI